MESPVRFDFLHLLPLCVLFPGPTVAATPPSRMRREPPPIALFTGVRGRGFSAIRLQDRA
jgi:hypothetical protein